MTDNSNLLHQQNRIIATALSWLCLLAVAPLLPLTARAQDTGYISGTVSDKSGAAVVNAEVAVASVGGSLTRNTVTNTDGEYVVAGLPGGTYDIIVTAKGFEKYQAKGVKLDVAQKRRVDIQLTVGSIAQTVEVSGGRSWCEWITTSIRTIG